MEPRFDLNANGLGARLGKRFAAASQLILESSLPFLTTELVSLRTSQINGCGFCADMHTKEAAAAGETSLRLNLVATWRESTVFTEPERAALALAEEVTRFADADAGVSEEAWSHARGHYDDDQLAALLYLIAMVNASNRLLVSTRTKGGAYEAGSLAPAPA